MTDAEVRAIVRDELERLWQAGGAVLRVPLPRAGPPSARPNDDRLLPRDAVRHLREIGLVPEDVAKENAVSSAQDGHTFATRGSDEEPSVEGRVAHPGDAEIEKIKYDLNRSGIYVSASDVHMWLEALRQAGFAVVRMENAHD